MQSVETVNNSHLYLRQDDGTTTDAGFGCVARFLLFVVDHRGAVALILRLRPM